VKSGLGVIQGHSKWYHWVRRICHPISGLQ